MKKPKLDIIFAEKRGTESCGPNHQQTSASKSALASAGVNPPRRTVPGTKWPAEAERWPAANWLLSRWEGLMLMRMLILAGMRVKVQRQLMLLSSLKNRPGSASSRSGSESVEILMWKFRKTIKGFLIKVSCPARDAGADAETGIEREKVFLLNQTCFHTMSCRRCCTSDLCSCSQSLLLDQLLSRPVDLFMLFGQLVNGSHPASQTLAYQMAKSHPLFVYKLLR